MIALGNEPFCEPNFSDLTELPYTVQPNLTREVVVLGSSGAGKSNLCNMLCKDLYFKSGNTITSVSKAVQRVHLSVVKNQRHYNISLYDTPGYFDSSRDDFKIQCEVNALLKFGVPYISRLFLLVEHSRVADLAYQTLQYYLDLINPESAKGIVTIVITKVSYSTTDEVKKSYQTNYNYNTLLSKFNLGWEDVLFVDLTLEHCEVPRRKTMLIKQIDSIMTAILNADEIHSTFKLFPALHKTEMAVNPQLLMLPETTKFLTDQIMAQMDRKAQEKIRAAALSKENENRSKREGQVNVRGIPHQLSINKFFCCFCKMSIVDASSLFSLESSKSIQKLNKKLYGKTVLLQLFSNPMGNNFYLLTFKDASVVPNLNAHSEHSWFPSYTWQVCACPSCHNHLGWKFKHQDGPQSFYGLIETHLEYNQDI